MTQISGKFTEQNQPPLEELVVSVIQAMKQENPNIDCSYLLQISAIKKQAQIAIAAATNNHDVDQLRSSYLGKRGVLASIFKNFAEFPLAFRPTLGRISNQIKEEVLHLLQRRTNELAQIKLTTILAQQAIDVTLPARGQNYGHLHPVTQVRHDFEDFFTAMGFKIVEGPEIEDDFHNFTALNIPFSHPARAQHDTFYFADGTLLRTHTSPVQIRAMQTWGAPLRIITPGRVYRCDSDATHTPMFHQLEGLIIDENVSFANLRWLVQNFMEYFFADKVTTRLRPSYFPFTEPSAEIDVQREVNGEMRWLEVFGCGMVHPNVLKAGGIDSKRYSGFAFGLGLDRFAMLRYGISDLRLLFENDLEFLEQF